jgi:hypothetical protein
MYFLYCEMSESGYDGAMSKMGRPKKPKAERKGEVIPIRVSADERQAIDATAEAEGLSRSDWMRRVLIAATKRATISPN